jgi:hypothetical protein
MTGILGSGFGLYGYLPAVASAGDEKVILLAKAKTAFDQRPELKQYEDRIEWVRDLNELMRKSTRLIFAVPSSVQSAYIKEFLPIYRFKQVVLEKPIAPTPADAVEVLELAAEANTGVRIGYSFLHTTWAATALEQVRNAAPKEVIKLTWRFQAHHYKDNLQNWKRYNNSGGGVIRFFGIQLMALISRIGHTDVTQSEANGYTPEDLYAWSAVCEGSDLPRLELYLDCNSQHPEFSIHNSGKQVVHLTSPFDSNEAQKPDTRILPLTSLLKSFDTESDPDALNLYKKINDLWRRVEEQTVITTKREA